MNTHPDQLVAYIRKHLAYEIEMFRYTYVGLQNQKDQLLFNALYESFCVHARNLMDFFFNQASDKERNYIAADFLPEGHPRAAKRSFGDAGKPYGLIHKEVLHMGAGRPHEQAKQVGPSERKLLADTLKQEIADFRSHIVPTLQAEWDSALARISAIAKVNPALEPATQSSSPSDIGYTGPGGPR